MKNVHLKIKMHSVDCVLRWRMEVKVNRDISHTLAVSMYHIQLTIKEINLNRVWIASNYLFVVVQVAISTETYLFSRLSESCLDVYGALLNSLVTKRIKPTPARLIKIVDCAMSEHVRYKQK